MGAKYDYITHNLIDFIKQQKIFFVATADVNTRINISPKEIDSFKIIDKNMVIWLNKTGSGNETAAHIEHNPRMTIMFCSFTEKPLILRLYGKAIQVTKNNKKWNELLNLFSDKVGVRQIFALNVDLVQSSCGFGVPFFDFVGKRNTLNNWAQKKGDKGLKDYRRSKNIISLDGIKIKQ